MSKRASKPMRGSAERCPKCASTKTAHDPNLEFKGYGPGLAYCVNCKALWEPLNPALIWDPDDPLCSFSEPCNNCAFRPGSEEQQDREKWKSIISGLKNGEAFYCHKGVPIEPGAEHGFAYPTKKVTITLDGVPPVETTVSDRAKLRLCRGYLNALGQWWKKDRAA